MFTANPIPAPPAGPNTEGSTPYVWAAAAIVAGLIAMVLGLLSLGPVGTVVAGIGVATGIVALLRTRAATVHPLPAVLGLVASAVAVAVGVVMIVVPALVTPATSPESAGTSAAMDADGFFNEDVEDVLAHELQVDFGDVTTTARSAELPITLTNKTDTVRAFYVTLGAFDSSGVQIATDSGSGALLGPHAIQKNIAFTMVRDKSTVEKMKSATFKVVAVKRTL